MSAMQSSDTSTSSPADDMGEQVSVPFAFAEDSDPAVAALEFAQDELLARILPGAEADDLQKVYQEVGATVVDEIPAIQTTALGVEADRMSAVARTLSTSPLIESVHKSYLYDAQKVPDDPQFERQDHLSAIGVPDAWDITTGDPGMIIAILDTGIESSHPDLRDKLIPGWNVHDHNSDTHDVLGHGTEVAGTAAASSDNAFGVAGISWDNPIMPVRVSSRRGRASSRNIAAGIVWAVDHGAKIINVSFAPLGADSTVLAAAQYARNSGSLVCISSGNSGSSLKAKANDNALFVGALDDNGKLASFSDTGPFVDFVAPGTRIRTTAVGGDFRRVNGTSFASPIVAGVAALVWSVNPDFRPATVVNILTDTAQDLGDPGRDRRFGEGMVDAAAAVQAAQEVIEARDDRPPTVDIIEPDNGQLLSGFARVAIAAFDAVGLADVVLSVDGVPFATDTAKPYRFTINTAKLGNGRHTLSVLATDHSGNTSKVKSLRIRVQGASFDHSGGSGNEGGSNGDEGGGNPAETDGAGQDTIKPTATITSPPDGSRVLGRVGIQATVTDETGLRSVEWLVDGVRQRSDNLGGTHQVVNFVWDASAAANGPHRVTVRVQDTSRNEGSDTVTLNKE